LTIGRCETKDQGGITQSVAMAIAGHKTARVYRRYRNVNEDDIRRGLEPVRKPRAQGLETKGARRPFRIFAMKWRALDGT